MLLYTNTLQTVIDHSLGHVDRVFVVVVVVVVIVIVVAAGIVLYRFTVLS